MFKYRWPNGLPILAALICLTSYAFAQESSQGNSTKSGDVNLEFSRVFVLVKKTGFGHDHAIEGKLKSGSLHLNAQDPNASSNDALVFDMTSFDADGDKARKYVGLEGSTDANTRKQVNANMLGKEVLNVKAHPTASFKPTSIHSTASNNSEESRYEISGDFTLHGVTQPVKFVATAKDSNGWIHLHGQFNIVQSRFGMKPYTKAFGAVGVADELTIFGDLFIAP